MYTIRRPVLSPFADYDDMSSRAETGKTDWHEVSSVLDVPSEALGIVIGALTVAPL